MRLPPGTGTGDSLIVFCAVSLLARHDEKKKITLSFHKIKKRRKINREGRWKEEKEGMRVVEDGIDERCKLEEKDSKWIDSTSIR